MHTIYVDSTFDDDARRERLYDGDLFVYSPRPSTRALVDFAAQLAEEAFGSLDLRLRNSKCPSRRTPPFWPISNPLSPSGVEATHYRDARRPRL